MPQEKKTDDKKILPNKRDWDIVPLSFFAPVVDVFQEAGKKYGRCSWMHCEPEELDQKYLSAALRHIAEYADGNQIDRDSGLPHLAHAMANLGILQWHREQIASQLTNEHNFGGWSIDNNAMGISAQELEEALSGIVATTDTPEVYGDTEVPVTWINPNQNPLKTVDHVGMQTLYHEVDYEKWVKAFVDSLPDCERVYLDVDGVICDFVGGMCKKYGKDPRLVREWDGLLTVCGITFEEMQKDISDYQFIAGLDEYPWDLSAALCERYCWFHFATAVDTGGRIRWIVSNGYSYNETKDILDAAKHKYAKPGYLLIDDNEENIKKWEEAGGIGVLFPAPWNSRTNEAPHHQYYASLAQ